MWCLQCFYTLLRGGERAPGNHFTPSPTPSAFSLLSALHQQELDSFVFSHKKPQTSVNLQSFFTKRLCPSPFLSHFSITLQLLKTFHEPFGPYLPPAANLPAFLASSINAPSTFLVESGVNGWFALPCSFQTILPYLLKTPQALNLIYHIILFITFFSFLFLFV